MIKELLAACALTLAASGAVAAPSPASCLDIANYLSFGIRPTAPTSDQPVRIVVGRYAYTPLAVAATVTGNTIDVTLTAQYQLFVSGRECVEIFVHPLPSGVYAVNLTLVTPDSFPPSQLLGSKTLEVTGPPAELSGLWWNASEPGWGISFTQRGNVVFAVWYTYDNGGAPKWYVAPRCEMAKAGTAGRCTESIYEVNGPTFFESAFNPSVKHVDSVGTMILDFADSNVASMSYSIDGLQRTSPITRQPLKAGTVPPAINYTDLWWNPDESGWGIGVAHEYDVMFLTWFVYDKAGKPMWYVASNCDFNASTERCSGALYRTTGPGLAKTFDATQVQVFPAGTVNLRFLDSNNAVLEYTVDGVTSTKNIKRQIF